jgi:hypothetical protein
MWVLGGFVNLALLAMVTCGIGGYFLMRKAKESGVDSVLLSKNPAYAGAKLAVTLNPEIEIVTADDSTGTLTIRDKRTGKTSSMRFDAATKQMVVVDENGKESSIRYSGNGDNASVVVQGPDGSAKFGAAAANNMPSWVPGYPNSKSSGSVTTSADGATNYVSSFTTGDSLQTVFDYYQNQLKTAGFNITQTYTSGTSAMLTGENGKHSVSLTASSSGKETQASLMAVEKQ